MFGCLQRFLKLTIMNFLQKITLSSKTKRFLFFAFLVSVSIILVVLNLFTPKAQKVELLTEPLVVTPTTSPTVYEPLDTTNPHNPTQKLVFRWKTLSPDLPTTITNYAISTPLINNTTISNLANKFGFKAVNLSEYSNQDFKVWTNDSGSLFGSTKQNQIMFNSSLKIPVHSQSLSQKESIALAKKTIAGLFNEFLLSTMDLNPEVRYLNLNTEIEDEPLEVDASLANLININFQQTIDQLPLLSSSRRGETISLGIDTTNKIYLLYVHGGYLNLTKKDQREIPSFTDLVSIAPDKAVRISSVQDIPTESALTEAKTVNIEVNAVSLGYYQREDLGIFPVFVISGNVSAPGISSTPAVYIVPATK